ARRTRSTRRLRVEPHAAAPAAVPRRLVGVKSPLLDREPPAGHLLAGPSGCLAIDGMVGGDAFPAKDVVRGEDPVRDALFDRESSEAHERNRRQARARRAWIENVRAEQVALSRDDERREHRMLLGE